MKLKQIILYLPTSTGYTLGQVGEPSAIAYREDPRGCGETTSEPYEISLKLKLWTFQPCVLHKVYTLIFPPPDMEILVN